MLHINVFMKRPVGRKRDHFSIRTVLPSRATYHSGGPPSDVQYTSNRNMAATAVQKDDIIFEEFGDAVLIIINRPKQLNAFTLPMMVTLGTMLEDFERTKSLVIMTSRTPNVYSSGGDVIRAAEEAKKKDKTVAYYPRYGYKLVNVIMTLKTPFVSLNNGLTMGGGAGMCMTGKYFVCTENSDFSMPECRIGHFPDVCASYVFSRLKNHIGFYLALTGTRLKGYDIVCAGIATHYCPSAELAKLEKALLEKPLEVDSIINSFSTVPENANFSLKPYLRKIDEIFSADTVEGIIERLQDDRSLWSAETLASMEQMCPLSLKVTLRQIQLARTSTLEECVQREYVVANTTFGGRNFIEGVRARLKDQESKPMWTPRTLRDVTPKMVENLFTVEPHMGKLNVRPLDLNDTDKRFL